MSEPTVPTQTGAAQGAPVMAYGWERLDRAGQRAAFDTAVRRADTAEARVAELEAQLGRARDAARDLLALIGPAPSRP